MKKMQKRAPFFGGGGPPQIRRNGYPELWGALLTKYISHNILANNNEAKL